MCHNILQEEDDDIPVSDGEKSTGATTANDDKADVETNGNISTKLATLSLDDSSKEETATAVNGNAIETESAKINENSTPEVEVANKKKGKKGAAHNNNNNINAAEPAEGKDETVVADDVENHKTASPSDDLINDANSATVQV